MGHALATHVKPSMTIHCHAMDDHRRAMVMPGASMMNHGSCHGHPWSPTVMPWSWCVHCEPWAVPWPPMAIHGRAHACSCMVHHGSYAMVHPWCMGHAMVSHGHEQSCHGCAWCVHGSPWVMSWCIHGAWVMPSSSMAIHGRGHPLPSIVVPWSCIYHGSSQ